MKHIDSAVAAHPADRLKPRLARRLGKRHVVSAPSRSLTQPAPTTQIDAEEVPPESSLSPSSTRPRLGLISLVAATFFVVSGGPYGLEEVVSSHGYSRSLMLLLIVPIVWSLPVALVVGEMSATLPKEGGYYAWVRRALGPFWGMQEAWLALAMSLFDMAIYPTLVVTYLSRIFPSLSHTGFGEPGWLVGIAMIGICTLWNLRGSSAVGTGSVFLGVLLLLPFLAVLGLGAQRLFSSQSAEVMRLLTEVPAAPPNTTSASLWVGGMLLCMWNYMGWDNASPIAAEVDRPQRTYPRAMALTVVVVVLFYTLPLLFAAASGMPPEQWTAGAWVEVGRRLGGRWLAVSLAIGGALCGLGMFTALMLSYSRLPPAMARDGLLPRWVGKRDKDSGAPKRVVIIGAVLYGLCMGLGFKRLVAIDVILYGAVIGLQFVSLIVLRIREPELVRPFKIPGGVPGLVVLSLLPLSLLGVSLWVGRAESTAGGLSVVQLGLMLIAVGPVLYGVQYLWKLLGARSAVAEQEQQQQQSVRSVAAISHP